MNNEVLRNLSLKILTGNKLIINLHDFDQDILEPKDIDRVCAFFEEYSDKYFIKVFETNLNNATIKFSDKKISELTNIIRNLNDTQFEKLSAVICKVLGYANFFATKATHDEGIDFIAYSDYSYLNIEHKQHILGQCKHYKDILVDVKDIRELAGSVILFSRKEFATTSDSYARFVLGSFAPINVFFISNYFFSKQAIELCFNTDIVPLDIIDITCICFKGIKTKMLDWIDDKQNLSTSKILKEIDTIEVVGKNED